MKACKVSGEEIELEPDHKGIATMYRPDCQPPDKPQRLWVNGMELKIVRSWKVTVLSVKSAALFWKSGIRKISRA